MEKLKINRSLADYVKTSYVMEGEALPPIELDCALGVNPLGCPEGVKKILAETEDPNSYPEYPYSEALEALSEFWSGISPVAPENFRLYAGSVAALDAICRVFASNGAVALGYSPQFTEFAVCVAINGGFYESVSLTEKSNYKFDEDLILDAMSGRHSLVYIDNPNNPTGQVIPLPRIERLLKKAEGIGVAVLVDEAYADYIGDDESAVKFLPKYGNLLVTRSFSKGYGLAGLRVGYVICSPELQRYLKKSGLPFTVTSKNAKAAIQALSDQDFRARMQKEVIRLKAELISGLERLEVLETDPRTPILAVKDPSGGSLYNKLLMKGVLAENGEEVGLDSRFVRLRVHRECDKLISILNSV